MLDNDSPTGISQHKHLPHTTTTNTRMFLRESVPAEHIPIDCVPTSATAFGHLIRARPSAWIPRQSTNIETYSNDIKRRRTIHSEYFQTNTGTILLEIYIKTKFKDYTGEGCWTIRNRTANTILMESDSTYNCIKEHGHSTKRLDLCTLAHVILSLPVKTPSSIQQVSVTHNSATIQYYLPHLAKQPPHPLAENHDLLLPLSTHLRNWRQYMEPSLVKSTEIEFEPEPEFDMPTEGPSPVLPSLDESPPNYQQHAMPSKTNRRPSRHTWKS